ncbi:hypothetical protein EDD11_006401 [Mortierella claussenii]|nr:hypothetical protein EDD11_006401 [Mortierella claussenii]
MLLQSISLALLATLSSVQAQNPNAPDHTYFTNPVTNDLSFPAGQNATFSWQMACIPPSTATSATPQKVDVHLVNSNDSNNAYYVAAVTTIDCTQTQGNQDWFVPDNTFEPGTFYSLKIILNPTPVYSGKFKIYSKNGAAASGLGAGAGAGGKSGQASHAPLSVVVGKGQGHGGVTMALAAFAAATLMFL